MESQRSRTPWVRLLMQPTQLKKFIFFLAGDSISIVTALYLSFLLRFDGSVQNPYYQLSPLIIGFFLAVKLTSFSYFRLYKISWRFVSLKDFYNVAKAVIVSSGVLMLTIYFVRFWFFLGFPRTVLIVDSILTLLFVSSLRISKRLFLEVVRGTRITEGNRTIIIGAGNTGEMVLRDIQKRGSATEYAPVAFLDDDPNVHGSYVHGVRVIGKLHELAEIVHHDSISAIIIAIPGLGHIRLREIYTQAKNAGVKEIKIVPRIYDTRRPEIRVQEFEDIKIEDLIGRQAIAIDYQEIGAALEGKTVLVTGAAGSIGFEIVKQACRFNPRHVVLFDVDETELHRTDRVLRRELPHIADRLTFVVGDVRDDARVRAVFARFKPELVFHAAAYKHVPMMEYNATEAVKVNIFGTHHIVRAAAEYGAERFVMISTDKAVRPTSIMGATKRIAEYICGAYTALGKTEYISVRFGNVLGSRGSVLPLFLEQIQQGEALTITHPEMQRYFMTIPEAVSLVLQAGMIGRGGDVMVLDMGKPVKILELAHELLRLHGLEPDKDIPIKIVGLRPGEKLFEEILTAEEGTRSTRHKQVYVAKTTERHTLIDIQKILDHFQRLVTLNNFDGTEIRAGLRDYIRWHEMPNPSTPITQAGVDTTHPLLPPFFIPQ